MKPLYLYLISQTINNDYDTFDSAVVVAESEDDARGIVPDYNAARQASYGAWAKPEHVKVLLVGTAADGLEIGQVVCASFNGG